QHQIARPIAFRPQDPVEPDLADRPQYRRDVAMRQAADDLERRRSGWHDHAALEERAEAFDPVTRPIRKVEQGPLLDLAALAIGLAQQDRRWGIAVGDALDIHDFTMPDSC